MKATETKSTKTPKELEKNYVIVDGKKVSRTWAAMLANRNNPLFEIIDMRAVLK